MRILWFSEIKWDYLRTRKQQVLSRFPESDNVLFIEPLSLNLKNHLFLQHIPPVHHTTIPQLRSTRFNFLRTFIDLKPVRFLFAVFAYLWLKLLLKQQRFEPDIIVTSNVYWIETIQRLIKSYSKPIPIVYDCNDDPMSFSHIPGSTREYFRKTVEMSQSIILPYDSYRQVIPESVSGKIKIIQNGVDYETFQNPGIIPAELVSLKKPVIMYIGALFSRRFDFTLVAKTAETHPEFTVVLIGHVSEESRPLLNRLLKRKNIFYFPPVPYERITSYLQAAQVCIIPFLKSKLASSILPNKLFEYAAAGKTCVMTDFNEHLKEHTDLFYIGKSDKEFIDQINTAINKPMDPLKLKEFAKENDWQKISELFHLHLKDQINQV